MKQLNTLRIVASSLAIAATAVSALAVPARQGIALLTQPDGTRIEVTVRGDERFHNYFTPEGELLIKDAEGYLTYATISEDGLPVASTVRVGQRVTPEMRRAASPDKNEAMSEALTKKFNTLGDTPRYIFSGMGFPATGEPHALVILCEYQDIKFKCEDPKGYFTALLNADNHTVNGATGSARQYFIESSNGLFKPTFDVYGPVTLSRNRSYYGANDVWTTYDKRPHYMALEAVSILDEEVDFSQYDNDGDGYIDNIFIFYAADGEATPPYTADAVWPHSADLKDIANDEGIKLPTVDGVQPNRYACTNEWQTDYNRPDGIGTFVHEFSHVLGLPDLYNTTSSGTAGYTPGTWSVLDSGPYNNDGNTPPYYSIHERFALNWCEPEELKYTGDYILRPINESNAGYIIATDDPDEFFLLECRIKEGFDKYIPGQGMLVWHFDFNQKIWDNNSVNNTRSHQYIDLVESDGNTTVKNGNAFPGSKNVTTLSASTTPSIKSWSGADPGITITDIYRAPAGHVSFHVEGSVIPSGIGQTIADKVGLYISGGTIYCNAETPVAVYDSMGAIAGYVSNSSPLTPASNGIHIVALPEGSVKVMVK